MMLNETNQEATPEVFEKGHLYTLAVGDIEPDPNRPRKYFDEEGLAGLTQSIRAKGVLQPVLFRLGDPVEEGALPRFVLVAGDRRRRAAQNAGFAAGPALFIGDDKPEEISLIENSLRQNLTAIEEAEAAGRLVSELGYSQEQVGKILGKKLSTVSEILSLNRLPALIRDECRTNPSCSRRVPVEIARKKQERGMLTLYEKYKEKGLTSDEVRKEAEQERKEKLPGEQASAELSIIAALQTRLENLDWNALTTEERDRLQEAVTSLTDAFNTIVEGQNSAGNPELA